ncbi:MAG TPA: hypothetical protein DEB06_09455, partial [Phycisphaerales bacterium]|nr:hypothetical protein [Phycisphaerales bacterium]
MSNRKTLWLIPAIIACAGAGASVYAQGTAPEGAPVAASTPAAPNTAVISAITGKVRVRDSEQGEWRVARVGEELKQGAWIQTGLRSAAQIRIKGQTITIDRLGTASLDVLMNEGGVDRTTVGLDVGRVVFDVQSTEFANDVQVRAPDATLAVKGTTGAIDVTPGQPTRAYGLQNNTGRIQVTYADGTEVAFEDDSQTDAENPDPASQSNRQTETDTGEPLARDVDENSLVDRQPGESQVIRGNLGTEGGQTSFVTDDDDENPPPPPPP